MKNSIVYLTFFLYLINFFIKIKIKLEIKKLELLIRKYVRYIIC